MTKTEISANFSVGPQIGPEDLAALKRSGITDVVCMRPDVEVEDWLTSRRIEAEAKKHGLRFHYRPITPGQLEHRDARWLSELLSGTDRDVFAYCRSGMRAASIWALGAAANRRSADEIVACCKGAGYDIEGLRPRLEAPAA